MEGEDCAKRYLEYSYIENQKMQKRYQEDQEKLKLIPLPQELAEFNKREHQKLKEKYDDWYVEPIGWAYGDLIKKRGKKPTGLTFKRIQEAVGLGQFGSFHKFASEAIHPDSPYGIIFDIGIPVYSDFEILAAPSYFNLSFPIFLTAQSLFQINQLLLMQKPNRNIGTFLFTMQILYDELNKSIERTEKEISSNFRSAEK
jgi:hypothetical protein